jgi:fused signal recognition particle receptor
LFEKLRGAFSSLAKIATEKKLSPKEMDEVLNDFQISLFESDVAQEVVHKLTSKIKTELAETKLERSQDIESFLKDRLREELLEIFSKAGSVDIAVEARKKKQQGEPFTILFLGVNGTGKTTTVAKFAYILKKQGFSVVVAAGDTHRAGAIEQLTEHANRITAKVISQRYGADPAAVARDGVLYAKAHHVDILLIDTAGRMQTNQNLMEEMAKIIRVVNPDLKIFVGDSLTGNDAVSQSRLFAKYTGFDGAILTKADADTKGGAALSITFVTGKPVLFLGQGQEYDDLVPFDARKFVDSVLQ